MRASGDFVHARNAGTSFLPVERLREGEVSARTGLQPERRHADVGEIACTVSRRYSVTFSSLADQEGLDPDLSLREGQHLMIPLAERRRIRIAAAASAPDERVPSPNTPCGPCRPRSNPPCGDSRRKELSEFNSATIKRLYSIRQQIYPVFQAIYSNSDV